MFTLTRMNKFTPAQLMAMASTLCQMQDLEQRILNGTGNIDKAARGINVRLYSAAQRSGAFHRSLFVLPLVTAFRDNHGLPFNRDFPLQINECRYVMYKPFFGDIRLRNILTGEEYKLAESGAPVFERTEGVFVFNGARVLNNTAYEDISGAFVPTKVVEEDEDLVLN